VAYGYYWVREIETDPEWSVAYFDGAWRYLDYEGPGSWPSKVGQKIEPPAES
jgi:hypothetical protein